MFTTIISLRKNLNAALGIDCFGKANLSLLLLLDFATCLHQEEKEDVNTHNIMIIIIKKIMKLIA